MRKLVTWSLDKAYSAFRQEYVDIFLERGMVSFSFDDFPLDALNTGGRILESYGWRGTYYTSMSLIGTNGVCGRIAEMDDLHRCIQNRHEIANHTQNHINCAQSENSVLVREVTENQRKLPARSTRNFAYPFGATNTRAIRVLSDYISTGRGIEHGINARHSAVKNLRANSVYSCNGMARNLAYIQDNISIKGWLIFYTHDVNKAPSKFGCTPEDFEQVLRAVKAADLDVVTIEEGRERLNWTDRRQ